MASIYKIPQHRAQIGYNGFDMSQYRKFTSSVGQLLPVYYDLLNPGDKINSRSFMFSRTETLNKAAMVSLSEHLDWFFVPMEQLYHAFNEFYNGVQDFNSSFFESSLFDTCYPYFNLETLKEVFDFWSISTDGMGKFTYFANDRLIGGALRLLDLLGFPSGQMINYLFRADELQNFSFIPVLLQAYQKIYMDYFRLNDREPNDPLCYNVDKFYNDAFVVKDVLSKMLTLRYAPYHKDFFTNQHISPIFSADNPSSVPNFNYLAVNQWLTNTYGLSILDAQGQSQGQGSGIDTTVGITNNNFDLASPNNAPFNVANIRSMFALDKLLEITRRAGKHYDKQTLAHFGVHVPNGISGEVFHLASFVSEFRIDEVTANSSGTATDGTNSFSSVLGQIGGKGYNRLENNNSFDFTAPCHGVLMCIYHAKPIVDYYQRGVDKINTLVNSVDWFKPEFDDLGMQPLFGFQEYLHISDDDDAYPNNRIMGWQYRYSELKSKYNTVNGGLAYIDEMKAWTTAKNPTAKNDVLRTFLVDPSYLDNIMLVPYDQKFIESDSAVDLFGTDPLIHMFYFDVKKASKMSTYGLPNL